MRNKKKKKKTQSIRTLIVSDILLLICVCMLGYPIFSDLWNAQHTSQMYGTYEDTVKDMDTEEYNKLLQEAIDYNNTLPPQGDSRFAMTDEERAVYQSKLKLPGTDVMAYITCDKIGVKNMPIYHGTGDAVLQSGVGHYEGSSLPVGGENTHCVLSGHTGMAGLKMFSELTKLEKGDTFQIKVLDKTLTYQVDLLNEVYPDDISKLGIEEGKDYCTLITCIPVGLNSQRLLVRGIRIPTPDKKQIKKAQQQKPIWERIWEWLMARFAVYELVMALGAALILLIYIIPDIRRIRKRIRERKK